MTRLLYMVSHPIQYQAPLLRRIAAEPGIQLRVVFEAVDSVGGYFDVGFGTEVKWDVPLRGGYDSVCLDDTCLTKEIAASDVVWLHGWASGALLKALGIARAKGKPVLMRGENWDGAMPEQPGLKGWLRRRFHGWVFARCAGFLAIGSKNRDYYVARGVPPRSVFSVPYAVDNTFFASRATPSEMAALRQQLALPPDRQVVLYCGKFMRRKRPDLLMRAWQHLPEPRPVLLMVGDGEMRDELAAMAGDGVVFAGFRNQTQLPGLYALADVFVLPSEREPWGLAVNEAMACGTAVVVSDQVGSAFDLVDESTGAVFPAGDQDALTHALARVLADGAKRGANAQASMADWDFEADLRGLKEALAHVAG
ncbi:MAG: glycosyltransferase family 4 protein [Rhodospirillaceae bacterium]|nr:glycosyltransferase family 4 protein [Rhodospirillales bacterium]